MNNTYQIHGKNVLSIKYISIAIFVSLLNSFYYDNFTIMILLAFVQILVLIKCLILGQDVRYLCYYIIFLGTSMESAAFVGADVFFGFKEFRVVGVNLGAVFLLLMLMKHVIKGSVSHPYKSTGYLGKFLKGVFILTPIAFFMGLFNLLINDNNVASNLTSFGMFIDASYIFIFVAIEVIVIYTIIQRNKKDTNEVKQCLTAVVISLAVTLTASLLFENYGNRGGLPSLQVSNIIMLLLCSILLPLYKDFNKKEKIILALASWTIFILGLIYNTNGKMIIIAMIIPVMVLTMLLKKRKYKAILFTIMAGIFVVFLSINIIIPSMSSKSFLFSVKMEQATSLLSFGDGWLEDMPESPKMRISQFLNTTYEYYEKPWFTLVGKGYLGTIKDHLSMFGAVDEFSYSSWEIVNNAYYRLHETLNTLYLTNGLIGLVFFFWMLKIIILNFHKSPWIMVGGFWFVLFYAYSITISIFGVTALIIGLFEIDFKNNIIQLKNKSKIMKS